MSKKNQGDGGGGYGKLEWTHEITLESGEVRGEITSTPFGDNRLGMSIVLCRQMPDGRQSKFLRPQDLHDAAAVAEMAERYCEDAQAEYKAGNRR